MIRFIEEITDANTAFGKMLREEAAIVGKSPDYYLFHEHLEAHNRPCYFLEVIARAQAFQLGYLGESSMAPQRFGEKVFGVLQKVSGGNILATEQYMDFFRNRSFRQTLLVHAESMRQIKRSISPETLRTFQFTSAFAPSQPIRPEAVEEVEFRDLAGRSAKVATPLVKSLLLNFSEVFPGSLIYEEMMAGARVKLQGKVTLGEQDFRILEDTLMRFVLDGVVRLHIEPIPTTARMRREPKAFAPARYAISGGATTVTNVRHENVALNQMDARTFVLLDGQTNREKLASLLVERTVQKEFTLMRDNVQLTQPEEIRPIIDKLLTESLEKFDRWALLVP